MDFLWVLFAFACGLGVKLLQLPPLVGFLCAGFLLNFIGVEPREGLQVLADLGITLMLFTIGLKLKIQDLLKREVWASSLGHMLGWSLAATGVIMMLAQWSVPYFTGLSMEASALLAFALSFSSTVCIVKLLEENGELKTRHGQIAIAVLVLQDIAAVVFLVLATGKVPSIWALGLLALIPLRPFFGRLLEKAGHGELLPLIGFFLALGGYELFESVGVKGDLGALVAGVLLAPHVKSTELSKSLLGFKDLFLIGFFLSIGFTALPDWDMLPVALGLSVLLPLKFFLFFFLFSGLRLRGRSAYLSSLALTNYSEFGLIIVALSVSSGWLPSEWLVILALAVSFSFVYTSILYRSAHALYGLQKGWIRYFERSNVLPQDVYVQPDTAEILVIGLGRVGKGAYSSLHSMVGDRVWGMDADRDRIAFQESEGLHVFCGDGEDADLWENLDISQVQLVLLALPSIEDNLNIMEQLRQANYSGKVAGIARYDDQRQALLDGGLDKVFNFFTEAGTGFAEESLQLLRKPV